MDEGGTGLQEDRASNERVGMNENTVPSQQDFQTTARTLRWAASYLTELEHKEPLWKRLLFEYPSKQLYLFSTRFDLMADNYPDDPKELL